MKTATGELFESLNAVIAGLTSELAKTATTGETSDSADLVDAMSRRRPLRGDRADRLRGQPALRRHPRPGDQPRRWPSPSPSRTRGRSAPSRPPTPSSAAGCVQATAEDETLRNWRRPTRRPTTPRRPRRTPRPGTEFAGDRLEAIVGVTTQSALETRGFAQDAERAALWRAGFVAAAVLVTLAIVTTLLATIARSVTLPLRRLRSGAVEVASVQLPAAVARIEQDGSAADITLPPVLPADSAVGPETLEVARAVDDLGAEAVRLATAQVRLRRALDEAFVSMSRRSQAMVEKQLGIIDELESQEQDPDQLRNLFRLDHLAARMRRYNDNLLVLAGSAVRTRATAPVKVAELFRAATSEMEQYERVRLQPVSGASISGTVAGELVHLLAELLDNAAMYSPPSSAIVLSAAFTADGGLQIEVLDAGVGISPGELDRLNARLAQPESIDTQVPSRMGLFVVARLARRGGFGVMLQSRPDASGTVAMVRVPPALVIGAPGSTGEQPRSRSAGARRPRSTACRSAARSRRSRTGRRACRRSSRSPRTATRWPRPSAAAAGVRSAVGEDEGGDSPLPRRRKQPPRTSTPPGLDPAEIAAANTMTPPGGLFTPVTPVADGEQREPERTGHYSRSAYADYGQGLGGQSYTGQIGTPTPDTSPGGVPALPADAGTPAAGLPRRGESPYDRTGPATGDLPERPRPAAAGPTGAISVTTGSSSASALPTGLPAVPGTPSGGVGPANLPVRPVGDQARAGGPGQPGRPRRPDDARSDDPAAAACRRARSRRPRSAPGRCPPARTPAATATTGRTASNGQERSFGVERFGDEHEFGIAPLTAPTGPQKTGANPSVSRARPGQRRGAGGVGRRAADRAGRPRGRRGRLPPLRPERADDRRRRAAGPRRPHADLRPDLGVVLDGPHDRQHAGDRDGAGRQRGGHRPPRAGGTVVPLGERSATSAGWPRTPVPPPRRTPPGTTDQGLPKRRPGANLLPSAASAAPAASGFPQRGPGGLGMAEPPPRVVAEADADQVRGRLGSYQRGLATARRARTQDAGAPAFDSVGAGLFTANRDPDEDSGQHSGDQGGDQ